MTTIKKPYHPMYIADYIIKFCTENSLSLNNLKLQKIMYYLQAQSLVESGAPLFDESLQKWKYGPVVPSVYHEYKSHGASNITSEDLGQIIRLPLEEEEPNLMGLYVLEEFNEEKIILEDRHTINHSLPTLAQYDPFDLVEKTHDHDLWKQDSERILLGVQGIEYDNDELKAYFEAHNEEKLWEK